MKKILLMAAAATLFAGCATHDAHYAKAKETYLTGKAIAEVVPTDANTSATLGVVDWFAVEYDTIRSWVRGEDDNVSRD